jgi:hypothetical protein
MSDEIDALNQFADPAQEELYQLGREHARASPEPEDELRCLTRCYPGCYEILGPYNLGFSRGLISRLGHEHPAVLAWYDAVFDPGFVEHEVSNVPDAEEGAQGHARPGGHAPDRLGPEVCRGAGRHQAHGRDRGWKMMGCGAELLGERVAVALGARHRLGQHLERRS